MNFLKIFKKKSFYYFVSYMAFREMKPLLHGNVEMEGYHRLTFNDLNDMKKWICNDLNSKGKNIASWENIHIVAIYPLEG